MWNLSSTEGTRINNHLEGFHAKINRWLDKHHPDVYKLILFLKMLDCNTVIEYNSRLNGSPAPKINYLTREKIKVLKENLERLQKNENNFDQFFQDF
ncbi:unnamed protein product [Brachionus calyciflorus]|uniref:Uncharacterized protein n=1 Tax=Brachionus calyciflorus TaxID=104777 RepID=A0A814ASB0_9BILA|nr:unnamed protein product [Brachionus calyciflorus]